MYSTSIVLSVVPWMLATWLGYELMCLRDPENAGTYTTGESVYWLFIGLCLMAIGAMLLWGQLLVYQLALLVGYFLHKDVISVASPPLLIQVIGVTALVLSAVAMSLAVSKKRPRAAVKIM